MFREDKHNNEIKGNKNLRNLIVNYVPLSFRERHLMKLFRTVGPITSCRIMRYVENGKTFSKGYGFVLFERPEHAKKAIDEFNGKEVLTKTIKVAYARPNARRSISNLFVAHIPPRWTNKDLGKIFTKYGNIIESRVLLNSCGLSRCCGFVRFDSNVQAEKAVEELNGYQETQHDAPLLVRIAFKSVTTKGSSAAYLKFLETGDNWNYSNMMAYTQSGMAYSGSESEYTSSSSRPGSTRSVPRQPSSRPGSARSVPRRPWEHREEIEPMGYSSTGYRTSVIKRDPAYNHSYTYEEDIPNIEDRYRSFGDLYSDPLFDKPKWASEYGSEYAYEKYNDLQKTSGLNKAADVFVPGSTDYNQYNKYGSYSGDQEDYYRQSPSPYRYVQPTCEPEAQASLKGNNSAGKTNNVADKKHALRVFNLSPKSEESEIRELFARYGEITLLDVPKTVDGLTIGMAHIYFGDDVSAQAAQKNLNGAQFLSNKLVVEFIPKARVAPRNVEKSPVLVALRTAGKENTTKKAPRAFHPARRWEKPIFKAPSTEVPSAQLVEAQ